MRDMVKVSVILPVYGVAQYIEKCIPFLFQLIAFRTLSAFTVNLAYNLEPVYSIAFAALLFGEYREVNFSFWLGLTLIVLSVLIQTRRVLRKR